MFPRSKQPFYFLRECYETTSHLPILGQILIELAPIIRLTTDYFSRFLRRKGETPSQHFRRMKPGERENHSFSCTNLRLGFEMNASTGHFEIAPFGTGDERKSRAIARLSFSVGAPSLFFKSAFRIGSTILE